MATYIQLDTEGSVSGVEAILDDASHHADAGYGILLLACDANEFTPENMDPVLRRSTLPLLGGTFPGVIHQGEVLSRGTIAVTVPMTSGSHFVPGLDARDSRFDEVIEQTIGDLPVGNTMLVFVDGLARQIGAFLDGLFNVFGLDLNYVGGGAGSLSMLHKPCLFTNGGLRSDGAVFAFLPCSGGVGVCHGWKELSGPYQVTEAENNIVKTLDWRPAFDVYAEALAPYYNCPLRENNFFECAKAYPFGISRLGIEQIVRDPLCVGPNGSLVCAGEVPEGAFVHLLQGDQRSLISAAGVALERARNAFPSWKRDDLHLFMDCVSRVLFLGDRFPEELGAVSSDNVPFVGACTIGEIANCGADFLEFYNKTSVVAILDSA